MSDISASALFALDPDALRCPHLALGGVREESSAQWFDEIGAYVVTRYADVMEVLLQPQVFSTRYTGGKRASNGAPVLLTADPPEHDRQRALVNRAFTPGAVKPLEPRVRALAESLVDRFASRGEVELVSEYATPLPMTVIAQYLGIPETEIDTFKRWSTDLVVLVGNANPTEQQLADLARSAKEFDVYFRRLLEERRGSDGDDLVSKLVNAEIDGDRLGDDEILTMLRQILLAGNDTTTNLIGSCGLLFAQQPELYDRVRNEPGFIELLLEEVLRLESPIQGLHRTTTVDTKVGDVEIPSGSQVLIMHAGADRDPAEFPHTDSDRHDTRAAHAATSHSDTAPTSASARPWPAWRARVALEVLAQRIARFELKSDAVVEYEPSFLLAGSDGSIC